MKDISIAFEPLVLTCRDWVKNIDEGKLLQSAAQKGLSAIIRNSFLKWSSLNDPEAHILFDKAPSAIIDHLKDMMNDGNLQKSNAPSSTRINYSRAKGHEIFVYMISKQGWEGPNQLKIVINTKKGFKRAIQQFVIGLLPVGLHHFA